MGTPTVIYGNGISEIGSIHPSTNSLTEYELTWTLPEVEPDSVPSCEYA